MPTSRTGSRLGTRFATEDVEASRFAQSCGWQVPSGLADCTALTPIIFSSAAVGTRMARPNRSAGMPAAPPLSSHRLHSLYADRRPRDKISAARSTRTVGSVLGSGRSIRAPAACGEPTGTAQDCQRWGSASLAPRPSPHGEKPAARTSRQLPASLRPLPGGSLAALQAVAKSGERRCGPGVGLWHHSSCHRIVRDGVLRDPINIWRVSRIVSHHY